MLKKILFISVFICFLSGCATTDKNRNSDISSAKLFPSKTVRNSGAVFDSIKFQSRKEEITYDFRKKRFEGYDFYKILYHEKSNRLYAFYYKYINGGTVVNQWHLKGINNDDYITLTSSLGSYSRETRKRKWYHTVSGTLFDKEGYNVDGIFDTRNPSSPSKPSHFIISLNKLGIKYSTCENAGFQCKDKLEKEINRFRHEIRLEALDYKIAANNFHIALKNNHTSLLKNYNLPNEFVRTSEFLRAIRNIKDKGTALVYRDIIQERNYQFASSEINEKIRYLTFMEEYNVAQHANLLQKKNFIQRYARIASDNCYVVNTPALNIRKKADGNSKKVGVFKAGETVCGYENKGSWLNTAKGWTSLDYLSKKNLSKYKKPIYLIKKQIDNGDYLVAQKGNTVISYTNYLNLHKNGIHSSSATKGLIEAYRAKKTFNGYMNAYEISKSKQDIRSAYQKAISDVEFKQVELTLFNSFDSDKFVKVDILQRKEGELEKVASSQLVTSFKGMAKDYTYKVKVSLDQSAGMRFKYGSYSVVSALKLNLDYSLPINGKGKDFEIKNIDVVLAANNNYSATFDVKYSGIPVSGEFHMLASTMLSGVASLFGMDVKAKDMGIKTTLQSRQLTYEVLSVESN